MEENEKSYSKLEWVFYIVILPLVFTLILTALLLSFLGENIADTAMNFGKKIPGISRLLPDSELVSEELEDQVNVEEVIAQSHAETETLQKEVEKREAEMSELKNQLSFLEEQLEEKRITAEEQQAKLRELASIYEGMSAKKAAAVLENLTLHEAALLIKQMPKKERSAIMEKLTPEKAAKITVVLKDEEKTDSLEVAALQERVALLMSSVETASTTSLTIQDLVNTLGQMPTDKSSQLLSEMSKSTEEFQLALKILAQMNDATRSSIMAEMETNIARNYISALASQ